MPELWLPCCSQGRQKDRNWAGKGAAPGCYVRSDGFNMLLPEENYDSLGITVQNHSYGVEIENFYGINAMAYDVSTIQNPSIIQVFSAGNDGLMASNSGKYANVSGFSNLTGNFKMAKNVLCVGAVDSFANLTVFSSHGPAYDGRINPIWWHLATMAPRALQLWYRGPQPFCKRRINRCTIRCRIQPCSGRH